MRFDRTAGEKQEQPSCLATIDRTKWTFGTLAIEKSNHVDNITRIIWHWHWSDKNAGLFNFTVKNEPVYPREKLPCQAEQHYLSKDKAL